MDDEFEILAAKVLAREATEAEHLRLQKLLAQNDERRMEFTALEAAWATLRAATPLVSSLNPGPALIPPERLRQLRQALRAEAAAPKVPSTPEIEWPRRLHYSAAHATALAHNWLLRRLGASPALVSLALLLLIAGAVFLINRPAKKHTSLPGSPPAAYLLPGSGLVDVRRDGERLASTSVTALRSADEIYIPPGTVADVITPRRWLRFEGPRTIATSALDGHPAAAQVQSNLTARSEVLRAALFTPATELHSPDLLVTTRSIQGIPLYSPLGATASVAPTILWKADPGRNYDLRITDEFDSSTPPWTIEAVRPPVHFGEVAAWKDRPLARDGLYRLRISESGQPLTTTGYTFRTTEVGAPYTPATAHESIATALSILAATPTRVGDALNVLMRLPADQANTELALRLKLAIFGVHGYQDDFDLVAARLRARSSTAQ
jgi:hypothetical protein